MKIIKFNKRSGHREIVLALGNFDGVHKGHQKLLRHAVSYAKKNGLPAFAMTFDPHPQEVVSPKRGLTLLTTLHERIGLMKLLGLDGVIVKKFTKKTGKLSPEKFIADLLVGHLKVKKVFVGFDFAFGRGRSGSVNDLKRLSKKYGFDVMIVSPFKAHGHLVKSSTIRQMIATGDFNKAIKLLGHSFQFTGKVIRGHGRGRELGFPTANITVVKDKLIPKHGVYYGIWNKRKCAIFIGSRPTFGKESFAIEAHILGFKGNLRGRNIRLDLILRLRDEIHFADVEKLRSQIGKDVKKVNGLYFVTKLPAIQL